MNNENKNIVNTAAGKATSYLLCEKRGCEFFTGDPITHKSDMENYRVYVEFSTPEGVWVFGDLLRTNSYDYSGKRPRLVYDCALGCDLQSDMFRFHPRCEPCEYDYTQAGVLGFVNSIAAEHYDAFKWVQYFEVCKDKSANFTPAGLMLEFAKKHSLRTAYFGDALCVQMYPGW